MSDQRREPGREQARAPEVVSGGASNLRGIAAMIAATASFCCGDAVMKLASTTLPTGELIFLRGIVGISIITTVVFASGAAGHVRRALTPIIGLRASGDVGGAMFFQSALARMPFPDLMSILQITPLSLTAASALFLGERVGWRRWTAVAVGMFGALLIIKPGTNAFNWWALAAIGSVLSGTIRDISTRRIDVTIPPQVIMLFSALAVTSAGLACTLIESWQMPSARLMAFMASAAVFSQIGQLCTIIAVRSGEISAVAPFRYTSIVWAILLGLLIWNHLPDTVSLIGICIIVLAGLYAFFREQKLRRLARRAAIDGRAGETR